MSRGKEFLCVQEPYATYVQEHFNKTTVTVGTKGTIDIDYKLAIALAKASGLKSKKLRAIWKRTKKIIIQAIRRGMEGYQRE